MSDPLDIVLVILGFLLLVTGLALLVRGRRQSEDFTVVPLLSPAEWDFMASLEEAAGPEFRLLAKVPLPLLVGPPASLRRKRRRQANQRLQQHLVDFLLCRRDDLTVYAVVSLTEDQDRLQDLEAILAAAGIPCLSFSPAALPTPSRLQKRLSALVAPPAAAGNDGEWQLGSADWLGQEVESDDWQLGLTRPRPKAAEESPTQAGILCPECGSAMVRRRMARGPHAGGEFWVCPNYPDCRRMLPALGP